MNRTTLSRSPTAGNPPNTDHDHSRMAWVRLRRQRSHSHETRGAQAFSHTRAHDAPDGTRVSSLSRPAPGRRTLTAQGHPRAPFIRAVDRGNLLVAETTAREIGKVSLGEELELALIAQHDSRRHGRAGARWTREEVSAVQTQMAMETVEDAIAVHFEAAGNNAPIPAGYSQYDEKRGGWVLRQAALLPLPRSSARAALIGRSDSRRSPPYARSSTARTRDGCQHPPPCPVGTFCLFKRSAIAANESPCERRDFIRRITLGETDGGRPIRTPCARLTASASLVRCPISRRSYCANVTITFASISPAGVERSTPRSSATTL